MGSRRRKKRRSRRKTGKIILFVFEILVLFAAVGILYFLLKTDKIEKDTTIVKTEEALKINDDLEEMQTQASESGEEWKMAGYTTVALFGVDARDKSLGKGNRADTMIIASINEDTGEVKLCSVYRDTYINLGNDIYNKANAAYSQGGPEQALQMLNSSLDLDIKDYATVNFTAMIDGIDAIGGVEIQVDENEIEHLNNYQISMAGREDGLNAFGEKAYTATPGVDYTPVTSAGFQNLNGLQATAFCRIRYVGNDFERTNRQREVLTAVANKAKKSDVGKLNSLIDEIFPKVMTSLSTSDLVAYASKAAKYSITDSAGFPFEEVTGNMGKAGSCVVATDFAANVKQLHTFLYGEDAYTPTARVQEISQRVASDRAKFLGK